MVMEAAVVVLCAARVEVCALLQKEPLALQNLKGVFAVLGDP